MGITKSKEKVRDGYLGDLPQDIQTKVMNVHKLIKKSVDDLLDDPNYADLKESRWAMTCIDDFCVMPKDKTDIGSIRVFKANKNSYKCMIQITGHFRNHQYGWIEELLHEFVANVFSTVRPVIRKKYDMTITNEGRTGNPYERFDLYLNPKCVKDIWEMLEDRKTKTIVESSESIVLSDLLIKYYESKSLLSFDDFVYKYSNRVDNIASKCDIKSILESIIASDEDNVIIEAVKPDIPRYNVDMSEAEAKKTLRTLSQQIMNDIESKKDYKITQYTANIYANIITKNLLPLWSNGYKRFSIILDSYQSFYTFEFKTPHMTQDFVSRLINGRESINGFLHRTPEIKIRMSPRIFHTMKNPDDAFYFFKAAIKYYDSSLEKASTKLLSEVMKMNHELKHLVSTTKLSGIVTYPLSLLFIFNDCHMDDRNTFKITQEDITTVNRFVKSIYTRYASPEKEKKQIVSDVEEMVKALREEAEFNDTIGDLHYLSEEVNKYLFGGYDSEIGKIHDIWIREQYDTNWCYKNTNNEIKYLQEKFGVKKLKKIPVDTVAYIQIETESIKDANDKMMIASYCLSKIEIVEWYIELLEVGSKKYVVPHTKPYLENLRTQLLACYKKIMDTPIPKKDRPIINVEYPKGYEG